MDPELIQQASWTGIFFYLAMIAWRLTEWVTKREISYYLEKKWKRKKD